MSTQTKLRDDLDTGDAGPVRSLAARMRHRRGGLGNTAAAPHVQATASAELFGATSLRRKAGKAADVVPPRCTTAAMNARPLAFTQAVVPGSHAILILNTAGWHTMARLALPANIPLLPLRPRCPALDTTENVWK